MDDYKLLEFVGSRIRNFRKLQGISQEEFAFRCHLDRTYISGIERGKRNVSLINLNIIATTLQIPLHKLFIGLPNKIAKLNVHSQTIYKVNTAFDIHCGFDLNANDVVHASLMTSIQLEELPFILFNSIDLKSLSGMVGALFAENLADKVGAIVNPIEKGHPDIIPISGQNASEKQLRNFHKGLEIKCTVGHLKKGHDLKSGQNRLPHMTGLTWQAHHREVESLMGLVIDFSGNPLDDKNYPIITAIFYSNDINKDDWGKISGTTGRNTKVTGMRVSGQKKMGNGWIILFNQDDYISFYESTLGFDSD
jgi:transcriptional regulator with XRE-family HTH domain